jgi:hypothetical protein
MMVENSLVESVNDSNKNLDSVVGRLEALWDSMKVAGMVPAGEGKDFLNNLELPGKHVSMRSEDVEVLASLKQSFKL